MGRSTRLNDLVAAFQTIDALRRPITAAQLAERIGRSRRTAYRYIDAASIVFPVVQEGGYPARFRIDYRLADRR